MKDRVIANGENWSRILADPSLNALAKRINRHFLYMGERDIEWLILQFEKTVSKKEQS